MIEADEDFLASIEEGIRQGRTNLFLKSARRLYELVGDPVSVAHADEIQATYPSQTYLVAFEEPVLVELVRRAREGLTSRQTREV